MDTRKDKRRDGPCEIYRPCHVPAIEKHSLYLYGNSYENLIQIGEDITGTQYDVARVRWGGRWQMPTFGQAAELFRYSQHTWTTQNGVNGFLFTGSNGGTIFLPAAGRRLKEAWKEGQQGDYWTSTIPTEQNTVQYEDRLGNFADCFLFEEKGYLYGAGDRHEGLSVRAVNRE